MKPERQTKMNYHANKEYEVIERLGLTKISTFAQMDITAVRRCVRVFKLAIQCHFKFPRCDGTRSVFKEQKVCRETCLNAMRICYKIWTLMRNLLTIRKRKHRIRNLLFCGLQPYRNAGDSPECWYEDFTNSTVDNSLVPEWKTKADCLYLNGSSYHGNISVTASGIPCQSWTEQCPHRHTMNTTYPELNNAKNYCRNPKNSGQRPWCFTTDRNKRWEYCDIPKCIPVEGNYGNWTLKNVCHVTCGEGFETWTRSCDNPEPKFGGRNCSYLGEPVEYRSCSARPCPVNGGYGNWSVIIPCNVSCGEGVEIWRRYCDDPEPKYSGSNCSGLGNSTALRKCERKPCSIDGNYGNWTKLLPCSVTCGRGVEAWIRMCDNPPGKYGGNCSKLGPDFENRPCKNQPCPGDSETIGIIVGVASFTFVTAAAILIFLLRKRWYKKQGSDPYYAIFRFSQHSSGRHHEDGASSSQENNESVEYGNLTTEGNPVPGLSRGVVLYRREYMNTRPSQNSFYHRLQVFRPMTVEWLRNAWGNVDEFGHHVYDVMQRNIRQIFLPYDRLGIIGRRESTETERDSLTYDSLGKPPGMVVPDQNALTAEHT